MPMLRGSAVRFTTSIVFVVSRLSRVRRLWAMASFEGWVGAGGHLAVEIVS
jgi:hypothetical protein